MREQSGSSNLCQSWKNPVINITLIWWIVFMCGLLYSNIHRDRSIQWWHLVNINEVLCWENWCFPHRRFQIISKIYVIVYCRKVCPKKNFFKKFHIFSDRPTKKRRQIDTVSDVIGGRNKRSNLAAVVLPSLVNSSQCQSLYEKY